jgi:hypothetical protein
MPVNRRPRLAQSNAENNGPLGTPRELNQAASAACRRWQHRIRFLRSPLAQDSHRTGGRIDNLPIQADHFAPAQAQIVQQPQQRAIAHRLGVVPSGLNLQ